MDALSFPDGSGAAADSAEAGVAEAAGEKIVYGVDAVVVY